MIWKMPRMLEIRLFISSFEAGIIHNRGFGIGSKSGDESGTVR
jgi:hypothetical protein